MNLLLKFLRNPTKGGQFMAATQATILDHRAKLTGVEREIQTAEADLDRAVATEDAAAEAEQIARLTTLQTRRGAYLRLLLADEQAEADRLAGARSKAERAQRRALKAQLSLIERHSAAVAAAQLTLRDSFRQLAGAAQSARALLPPPLRGPAIGLEGLLSASNLRRLCEIAAYKASQDGIAAPGCDQKPPGLGAIEDRVTGFVPALPEMIASRVTEPVRRHLAASPQKSNPLVAPYASERAPGGVAATGSDRGTPEGADRHHRSYVVDLRSAQPASDEPTESDEPTDPMLAPLAALPADDPIAEPGDSTSPAEPPPPTPSRRIVKYV